jgi:hypothetical protein
MGMKRRERGERGKKKPAASLHLASSHSCRLEIMQASCSCDRLAGDGSAKAGTAGEVKSFNIEVLLKSSSGNVPHTTIQLAVQK